MHDVAQRMLDHEYYQDCRILYMGDHDPSGIDMHRDIRTRLQEFGCTAEVERIALTQDQIDEYDLPPNPTKKIDPRSRKYYEKYGSKSWELDALDPEVLTEIVEGRILEYLDKDRHDGALRQEQKEKDALERAVAGMIPS